jgi:hypothetical protein
VPIHVPLIPFIRRRRRPRGTIAPAALNLVAAEYAESTWVQLTFDRPIDIGGLVGNTIVVNDGSMSGARWEAIGTATLMGPETVRIAVVDFASATGPATVLDVGAGNGIVAVDDGGTWGGVSELPLPFP